MARIALIHALAQSPPPAHAAFARGWPQARLFDVMDTSLSADLAAAGRIDAAMIARFVTLARYAAGTGADGILFTCSAFGAAIEACQRDLAIPVLKPNEAALEEAVAIGRRIALVATFPDTLPSMTTELLALRPDTAIVECAVDGALAALAAGDGAAHDRLVVAAIAALPPVDVVLLTQFSLARAAGLIQGRRVLTTPDSAVAKLRRLVEARRA